MTLINVAINVVNKVQRVVTVIINTIYANILNGTLLVWLIKRYEFFDFIIRKHR